MVTYVVNTASEAKKVQITDGVRVFDLLIEPGRLKLATGCRLLSQGLDVYSYSPAGQLLFEDITAIQPNLASGIAVGTVLKTIRDKFEFVVVPQNSPSHMVINGNNVNVMRASIQMSNAIMLAKTTTQSAGSAGPAGESVTVLSFAYSNQAGYDAAVAANAGNPRVFVVRYAAE